MLETLLRPYDTGFEFGSGRSTLWYAKRLTHLISVEESKSWAEKVQLTLTKEGVRNVELLHVDCSMGGRQAADAYTKMMRESLDCTYDFVMVDGNFRSESAEAALVKLKPGAILVIDNVERYLPSGSRSPRARSKAEGPLPEARWPSVWNEIQTWRSIWTTSGVTDTAIFLKPCSDM